MRITEVRIQPVNTGTRLKAYAVVVIDGGLIIRDMKIIEGPGGCFVAMPAKKMKDGSWRDLVHPLNAATRQMINDAVMLEYRKVAEKWLAA